MTIAAEGRGVQKQGQLYRMLWRWHFYAGLICIPFVIALAITGSVYLFRPQIEAAIDQPFSNLAITGQRQSADAISAAATGSIPGSKLAAYQLPAAQNEAVQVLVSDKGARTRVYVHPQTLEILKSVDEEGRFNRIVFKMHGELLLGPNGSILVELAACWAIVMVLSGLYLWWPRNARGLGGVLYPRLGTRHGWRDLHAVTGVWVSAFALFLLVTGLPWASVWGEGFKQVRAFTGTAAISQDWATSSAGEHAEHAHADMNHAAMTADDASLQTIVTAAEKQNLAWPVLLTPPAKGEPFWWAKSNAQNRPERTDVAINAKTADIVTRNTFAKRHIIDQIVAFGIAAHEGQLFGWLNQLIALLTACGLILLCVSAFVMWRKRAPKGVLGAPPVIPNSRIGWGLAIIIGVCGLLLPVLGMSLIAIALIEWLVLARWPAARRWLGLSVHAQTSGAARS